MQYFAKNRPFLYALQVDAGHDRTSAARGESATSPTFSEIRTPAASNVWQWIRILAAARAIDRIFQTKAFAFAAPIGPRKEKNLTNDREPMDFAKRFDEEGLTTKKAPTSP